MNFAQIHETLSGIHHDLITGDLPVTAELSGLISQAATVAKREDEQFKCIHPGDPIVQEITNRAGRFASQTCAICFKLIKLDRV